MPRKKKYKEQSVTIGFRVPKSKAEKLKKAIQKFIDKRCKETKEEMPNENNISKGKKDV